MGVNLLAESRLWPSTGNHSPVKYFVGLIAIIALIAGATVAGYWYFENDVETRGGDAGDFGVIEGVSTLPTSIPAASQVIVQGSITSIHLEGARVDQLPLPLVFVTPSRGEGGATFLNVQVDGEATEIDWDSGQPLRVDGDGGFLVTGPLTIDTDPTNTVIGMGDAPHGFSPGTYSINSSVAVGAGRLARAADSVSFVATDGSSVAFRGTASSTMPTVGLAMNGAGSVVIQGDLTLVRPDRSQTKVKSVTLTSGPFHVTTTSENGNLTVQATLQGAVTTA